MLQHKSVTCFFIIFALFLFLRLSFLLEKAHVGWDQIDSAWAANNIIVNKYFVLQGPVAKGNSGIYMGPLYFYANSIVYFVTNMDLIASPIFQSILSIGSFLVLYFVTKKIFGIKVALIACIIGTFSLVSLDYDRIQSAYYLIVPISYLIFYALYKVIIGKEKYILLLALFVGLSFHIDFTAVFYPILIFLALPFFPRTKNMLRYGLLAIMVFLFFISPIIVSFILTKHASTGNFVYLLHTFYHGFHLRRVVQIAHDGFISFEQILQFPFLKPLSYGVLPIFMLVYYRYNSKKQSLLLFYLLTLWVVVPWFVLSTYSGELTDYYFSPSRYLAIAMLAYLTLFLLQQKSMVIRLFPVVFWAVYAWYGVQLFFSEPQGNLLGIEASAKRAVAEKKVIPYKDKDPFYYAYYQYERLEIKK